MKVRSVWWWRTMQVVAALRRAGEGTMADWIETVLTRPQETPPE